MNTISVISESTSSQKCDYSEASSSMADFSKNTDREKSNISSISNNSVALLKKDLELKKCNLTKNNKLNNEMLRADVSGDENIVGIYIEKTSRLYRCPNFNKPVVRISFVDSHSGRLLPKSSPDRLVTGDITAKTSTTIPQICSQRGFVVQLSYFVCMWDEFLTINENVEHINSDKVVLFFEIEEKKTEGDDRNVKRHCWAFLRIKPSPKFSNINQQCSLQLYRYVNDNNFRKSNDADIVPVYKQWLNERIKYDGRLSVTVKSIKAQQTHDGHYAANKAVNPKIGLPKEIAQLDLLRPIMTNTINSAKKHKYVIKLSGAGGLATKFSSNGKLFAYADTSKTECNVFIASVEKPERCMKLASHSSIIHDFDWAPSTSAENVFPQYLVSGSADYSAVVWCIQNFNEYKLVVMQHTNFVYAVKFLQWSDTDMIVATGSRDGYLNIWEVDNETMNAKMIIKQQAHFEYITNVLFDRQKSHLYSCDSLGTIKEWHVTAKEVKCLRTFVADPTDQDHISGMNVVLRDDKLFYRTANQKNVVVILLDSGTTFKFLDCSEDSKCNDSNVKRRSSKNCLASNGPYMFISDTKTIKVYNMAVKNLEREIEVPDVFKGVGTYISSIDYCPRGSHVVASVYGVCGGVYLVNIKNDYSQEQTKPSAAQETFSPETIDSVQKKKKLVVSAPIEINNDTSKTHSVEYHTEKDGTFTVEKAIKIESNQNTYSIDQTNPGNPNNNTHVNVVNANVTYDINCNDIADEDTTISYSFN